jgi:hypothetical protein
MPDQAKPPVSAVVNYIRKDIQDVADRIHHRVYRNGYGYTSAQVLAAFGVHASDVVGHIASLDALAHALGLLVIVDNSGVVILETSGDSASGL